MITFQRFACVATCVCVALTGVTSYGGHGGYGGGFGGGGYGGYGGGGFNWGSLFGGGGHHYGGGHQYRNGGHQYAPRRTQPNYVTRPTPQRTYVAPRANPTPRVATPYSPPKTYVTPHSNPTYSKPKSPTVVPKSNGSALAKSTAPKSQPPKAAATHTAPPKVGQNLAPHPIATSPPPRANSSPTVPSKTVAKSVPLPVNPLPVNPAHENLAPASHNLTTKPTPNVSIQKTFACSLPASDKLRISHQLNEKNKQLIDQVDKYVQSLVGGIVDKVPGAHDLSATERQKLIDAVNTGDIDRVKTILGPGGMGSRAGQQLLDVAELQEDLDDLRDRVLRDPTRSPAGGPGSDLAGTPGGPGTGGRINNGTGPRNPDGTRVMSDVTGGGVNPGADLGNVTQFVTDTFPPGLAGPINTLIAQIAVNTQVMIWIDLAPVGPNLIPAGPNVPIALIPGLPPDFILPTGFGPTLIGMGPGDQIFLGEGDVTEVAGMPEPIGPPVEDLAGPVASGRIVLTNVGVDVINYNVNQQPFNMQPRFQQVLTDGTSWVVEFDRGGGNGMARYTLTEGTYEFTPTQTGWDLFKKTFRVQLENMLEADFNYVVSDQQQLIGPGQIQDLSGPLAPVISFDNGRGQILQKQLDGTEYRITLSENDTFDIYPAASVPDPTPQTVEVPVVTPVDSAAPLDAVATAEPAAAASPTSVSATVNAAVEPAIAAPVAPAPTEAPPIGSATPEVAAVSVTPPTTVATTRMNPLADRVQTRRVNLPAGFRLFDPVAALTPAPTTRTATGSTAAPVTRTATGRSTPARRLPLEFTLFEAAQAAQRAAGGGL